MKQGTIEASVQDMATHVTDSNLEGVFMSKSFDSIAAAKSTAAAIYAGANALEIINTQAAAYRAANVKFGKSVKTCQHRAALADAMAASFKGKAAKTYANYVTAFVAAVNDNVPFSFSASKGKAKGKGGTKAAPEFAALLAKVVSHPDFAAAAADIQGFYDDAAADTLAGCIQVFLETEGYEISE